MRFKLGSQYREDQPYADVFENKCSYKLCKIDRKAPVLESLF